MWLLNALVSLDRLGYVVRFEKTGEIFHVTIRTDEEHPIEAARLDFLDSDAGYERLRIWVTAQLAELPAADDHLGSLPAPPEF